MEESPVQCPDGLRIRRCKGRSSLLSDSPFAPQPPASVTTPHSLPSTLKTMEDQLCALGLDLVCFNNYTWNLMTFKN